MDWNVIDRSGNGIYDSRPMKLPILSAAGAGLILTGCGSFDQPISEGDFDPLRAPGSTYGQQAPAGPMFRAGQFVRAVANNTAFFKERPRGNVDADKLLPRGTSMRIVALSGTYLRVELDSGEVGFVPAVMVEDPNAAAPEASFGNEFQVYPPIGGFGEPAPLIPPAEAPPGGSIPTVIDPEAPSPDIPVPPVSPLGDGFEAAPDTLPDAVPDEAPRTPAPLPPNHEELEAARAAAGQDTPPEISPQLED